MNRELIISELFQRNRERLKLSLVSGDLATTMKVVGENLSPADLVGHLNLIHPERLQVIGAPEIAWIERLGPARLIRPSRMLFPPSRRR